VRWFSRRNDTYCGAAVTSLPDVGTLSPPSSIAVSKPALPAGGPCAATALANAPIPATIFGLEVSHHNGVVDWNDLKSKGYFFVSIKASQRVVLEDPRFIEQWNAAGQAGFIRSAYHFMTGDSSGQEQATFFLDVLKKVTFGPCDLGPLLVFEGNYGGCGRRPFGYAYAMDMY